MPKGLVKTDNVQVNHIAARGENTLCIAFMNECARRLRDVTVRHAIPAGAYKTSGWRGNQRETEKLQIINGTAKILLSPKGITALVIEGLKMRASFQPKFTAAPSPTKATTDRTIPTPFGEAHAMTLSFGPELTWLYAYLSAERGTLKSAKLHVTLAGREKVLTDDAFPFEFSLSLKPSDKSCTVRFESTDSKGQPQQSMQIPVHSPTFQR